MSKRIFVYEGVEYEDPDPELSNEQVRDLLARTFGALAGGQINTQDEDGRTVVTFSNRPQRKGTINGHRVYRAGLPAQTNKAWVWLTEPEAGYWRALGLAVEEVPQHKVPVGVIKDRIVAAAVEWATALDAFDCSTQTFPGEAVTATLAAVNLREAVAELVATGLV